MFKCFFLISFAAILGSTACNSNYTPKSIGYPAMRFPTKVYRSIEADGLPYYFDIPTYAFVDKNVLQKGVSQQKTGWVNLQFPSLNATLYISYNTIQKGQLEVLVRDAYTFANNHASKASFIEDSAFENPQGLPGVFFHLGGEVASPYQFFITDSSQHFLRGALYFDTTPNADSLAPAIDFLYHDLIKLVNTFHWKT